MIPQGKVAPYYAGCNEALLRAVPPSARSILEVGCGEGLPPAFFASGRAFARKWSGQLPVATSRAVVDDTWLATAALCPPHPRTPARGNPEGRG
jgi:hypothetical protein